MSDTSLGVQRATPHREVARAKVRYVLAGWCVLACADVSLRLLGFPRFYNLIRRLPTVRPRHASIQLPLGRAICAGVDRARAYYVRRAWCLQAAAAAVCLLRLRGVRGDLVIGVRQLPFYAHAWVTVDRVVVLNSRDDLSDLFREIIRC